jgi:excisionase family DNA binding protein
MHLSQQRLLTIEQAAEYLGFTERHLRRLANERRIAHIKGPKLVRFDKGDLDAWIDANRREVVEP